MKKLLITLLPLLFLSGCATVEDFQKMTPDQRARMICEQDNTVRRVQGEKYSLEQNIQSSQTALARGYKVHQDCKQVEVYGDITTVCKEHRGKTVCKEHRPVSTKTECHDIPVSIDAKLEKENIRNWTKSLKQLDKEVQSVWSACYSRAYRMTPEQAYEQFTNMR